MTQIKANLVDVVKRRIFSAQLVYENGHIVKIQELGPEHPGDAYLVPGFVDAHVHIESSMLIPDEFAFAAMEKGTLGSVSDPHEIANVLGMQGIEFMRQRAALTPFKIMFGAPSCVPATPFETAGATLSAQDIETLFSSDSVGYLSEMMNFPGVLHQDPDVMEKLAVAQRYRVPIDGHAPGLKDLAAQKYTEAGISTDHECTTLQEAQDKIAAGMHILIREGSAARDFQALHSLLSSHPQNVMLCSDDKHPDDLLEGHIREQVIKALDLGHELFDVLNAATLNPIRHYGLPLGLLQVGDSMDALLVKDLSSFYIQRAWINGEVVVVNEQCQLPSHPVLPLNLFNASEICAEALKLPHPGGSCRVIEAEDGKLFTRQIVASLPSANGFVTADIDQDILFLAVVNRYHPAPPAVALIKGFGLKEGAIASSVAHDSHNIVAVGTSAQWLAAAINQVIAHKGGLAIASPAHQESIALPVAGLMSDLPAAVVGPAYHRLNSAVQHLGSPLHAPFMTLSFMALLVIPELKLSDKGLFDGTRFRFCSLSANDSEPDIETSFPKDDPS
ncbi:MAG: adenine deaminase [Hahellaceae bacterium]|nr:adenine deaminase [Hahellaceae bacterium]MCP5168866.1 adenine deaminase [Hahellaceae bacterium]